MPEIQFGFMTDLHHALIPDAQFDIWQPGAWRVYSTALARIQAALDYWYAQGITFAVMTGDNINGAWDDITDHPTLIGQVMTVINASDFVTLGGGQIMIMPGNHEYTVFGSFQQNLYGWDQWWVELNTGAGHVTAENTLTPAAETGVTDYSYDVGGFRFIVLNVIESNEQEGWYVDRLLADNTPVVVMVHDSTAKAFNFAPTTKNMQLIVFGHDHVGMNYFIDQDVSVFGAWGSVEATHGTPWTSADNAYYKITVKANAVGGVTNSIPNVEIVGQELGSRHNKSFDSYFIGA